MLGRKDIEKFKIIYKKHYGVVLSDAEAVEKAGKLLNLIRIISKSKLIQK